ncbi:DUF688 domain-containing protein [Quillaja saponaria]|uniref:DUF688 domain-containing protein n=1 Tax=Quillaja saponaria TaxID=32244 RepID=A0AAD7LW21_QUISA|nr:DUF688 domain-containing protein [Quillaja saponaria]
MNFREKKKSIERERAMGSESELVEHELSSGPKLALFSLPSKPSETPGLLSPPSQTTASIPFQWEEAPGKPRPCNTQFKPNSARSLELPPRLLFSGQAKVTNMPSPTTVLDGPYVGQNLSFSSSFRNPADSVKSSGYFGSRRWSSFRKNNKEVVESNFDFSASVFYR